MAYITVLHNCLFIFVLSDVIVEDIVGLWTCTCTYKKAMVYVAWYTVVMEVLLALCT